MKFSAQQIATMLNGTIVGNPDVEVNRFAKIEEGQPGSLTFLANPKYEPYIYTTQSDIVLINNDFIPSETIRATLIKVPNAYAALATLLNMVEKSKTPKNGIDSTAFVAATATTGENCYIGAMAYIGEQTVIGKNCLIYPHVYIGDHVTVGDYTIIYPHATIYDDCVIGNHCILQAGSVIGSDGFGFAPEDGKYIKIPQLGNVVLEDEVEIGANTTVDRAVMGSTIIRRGVKLDNLIQIAHNVEVGEHTVMAAQAGVAGSTKIGHHCMFGGQVGLSGHLKISDHVSIAAQSGVMYSIEKPGAYMGSPAKNSKEFFRTMIYTQKLSEIMQTIRLLQKEIDELKSNK